MKRKVITKEEIVKMDSTRFQMINSLLNIGAFGLLGIYWTKWIKIEQDPCTGDIVIEYE